MTGRPTESRPPVCRIDEIPDGEARGFGPFGAGRHKTIIVRRADRVFAWLDACPHYGDTPMAWRTDGYLSGDRRHLACHAHGALLEIESGSCVLGPCLGQALQPVPVVLSADGRIWLADEIARPMAEGVARLARPI